MIKRIIALAATILLLTSVVGCGMFKSTTQKYLDAFNKTQKAESLQSQTRTTISIDLSKAPEDIKKELGKYKDISLNTDEWIDNKNGKSEIRGFLKAGEIMLDSKLFSANNKAYLKSSITGDKYIELTPSMGQQGMTADAEENKKLFQEVAGIWKNAIESEILVSSGNSIENTPDGDIKVSILSLELNDAKVKGILKKLAQAASTNETIIAMMAEYGIKNSQKDQLNMTEEEYKEKIRKFIKELPVHIEALNDKYAAEKLKLTAKIDKDSYIIDEQLEGTLLIKFEGEIRISFNIRTTRWNIDNGKVKVELPDITKENTMDINELDMKDNELYKKFMKQ
ncbi:MAG: hypothetical protein N2489_08585 [Clostridia bacterium]|nr:hypothetical protein [Clostridia bacterium]